jgi:hypothetical protein
MNLEADQDYWPESKSIGSKSSYKKALAKGQVGLFDDDESVTSIIDDLQTSLIYPIKRC